MDKDNKESLSNNNWLSLLRRKIQKKFKRNRQKLENSSSLDDILDVEQEIPEPLIVDSTTSTANIYQSNSLSAEDCEEMKKELFKLSWYWPKLTRIESQQLLSCQPNGSFLVRYSSSEKDSFTLSFRTHSKTFHCRNQWSQILASKNDTNLSLIDIIEDTIKKSQSSVVGFVKCDNTDVSFPTSYAVRLIYPICRKISVPSLQSICLSKIKSKVTQTNINSLPLPPRIKEYVREHYNTL